MLDYRAAAKQIADGNHKPVYVCLGIERYLIDQFIQYIVNKFILEENKDFAVSQYDLREIPIQACIEDAETLPFMAEKKIVIGNHASLLTAAREKQKAEHDLNRLADYLEEPSPFTIMILAVEADKLDERKKVVKLLKKQEAVVSFPEMDANTLRSWVLKQARKLNCEMDEAAADALIMNAGTNLQHLVQELEKLSLYAGEERMITSGMIEQLTARTVEQNIFLLVDEIVKQNVSRALSIFRELLSRREEPIKILMLIARQFRIIMQVKELSSMGYTNRQIAGQIGQHPYAVKVASDQAKNYSIKQLQWMIDKLAETDYQMKTGRIDKILAIELAVLELVHMHDSFRQYV